MRVRLEDEGEAGDSTLQLVLRKSTVLSEGGGISPPPLTQRPQSMRNSALVQPLRGLGEGNSKGF